MTKRQFAVLSTAAAIIALFAIWRSADRRSLTEVVEAAARGVVSNQPELLYDNCFVTDRDLAGITRKQFAQIWDAVVWPRLRRLSVVGKVSVEQLSEIQGIAEIRFRARNSRTYEWLVSCEPSEDGPGVEAYTAIIGAWQIEYVLEAGLPFNHSNVISACLKGLERDRATMERIGLKGLPSRTPGKFKLNTWDFLAEYWKSSLANDKESPT
jgi:hypothetical protein